MTARPIGAWFGLAVVAVAAMLSPGVAQTQAQVDVDLALVIAVDISYSMDPEEQELQRNGFIEAFRSSLVHDAIARGALGRIAVVYAEWAASWEQRVIVPWTIIDGAGAAIAFADRLSAQGVRRGPRTSISGAIDLGVKLLDEGAFDTPRKVVDISGDGANNQGRSVTAARDEAVAKGVTLNGLPIMLKRSSGWWDFAELDDYYRDCVIGGQGAFMVPVREREQFKQAIKTKIILEIAGLPPPANLVVPAQGKGASDCSATENRGRDRFGP